MTQRIHGTRYAGPYRWRPLCWSRRARRLECCPDRRAYHDHFTKPGAALSNVGTHPGPLQPMLFYGDTTTGATVFDFNGKNAERAY
jgi:hypothetical protein